MNSTEQRLQVLEEKLHTPENFSVREYLNYGPYSVVDSIDRELILQDFEKLSTAEQQSKLSCLFALQPFRKSVGIAYHITCGYRSKRHELKKGRTGASEHLNGAVDGTCLTDKGMKLYNKTFSEKWHGGFKYYENNRFFHKDLGRNRTW